VGDRLPELTMDIYIASVVGEEEVIERKGKDWCVPELA